ncbi:MAG TPA: DUF748 domain-containing protein [Methylomirabilota bacterium]|jgi:hypothetical protein|nr:DUF748 domain-containing protein [Methylomirabilota bacterium]
MRLASAPARIVQFGRRRWIWILAIAAVPVILLVAADVLLDEPLRRVVERDMNARLHGYRVTLPALDFRVLGFSVALKDLLVLQEAHPDPPVARIPKIVASVQWKELVFGHVVADFRIDRPVVYANLEHFRQEQKDPVPIKDKGWQDALQAAYPFKINELKIVEGEVAYEDRGPYPPLRVSHLNIVARNIRNIHSREHTYPSELQATAVVFDSGRLAFDGHADFMAEPHAAFKGDVRLEEITLGYFKPITQRYNLTVSKGTLSADGTVEYGHDGATLAQLRQVTVDGALIDYVHSAPTKAAEQQTIRKVEEKARQVSNAPETLLRVDRARIVKSTFGFVNEAAQPPYRVFIADTDIEVKNLSNHMTEGMAVASLRGKFMGSGATVVNATFRPEMEGPDFDLAVAIEDTQMRAMNDLLRAYGKFDVVGGLFSFYSELSVKHRRIEGYVKPLFRDLKVYDKRQDQDKTAFRKLYERLVEGVSKLLENRPRSEVATKAEVSGSLDDPKTSTWQVIVRLIQNAFFKAILPGFDEQLSRPKP